ncbi:MAG: NUDIX hydrolase [Chloroflexota bacterium]
MDFKVLSSEHLYQGRVFDLWREKVQYPDGRVGGIEFIKHGGAVTILPIDDQGRIWFVRQYRHPTGIELLELPAGTLEPGEDPAECAARELREEIGMAADQLTRLGEFFLAPGYSTEYMYVFLGRGLRIDPLEQDTGELIIVEKYSVEEVWQMVKNGEIKDAKTLAILSLAREWVSPD